MNKLISRIILALTLIALAPLTLRANQAAHGFCEAGAQPVVTSGLTSTTTVQASFPACTITVFVHGGGLASIFSDNNGTPLANPFTAQSNGQWVFYAANGRYDIQMSGAGFPSPVTISDLSLADPANQQAALPNTVLSTTCTPSFGATNNSSYTFTLSGCNATATVTGTPANGNLLSLTLIEDTTGGWGFTFPANFILPLGFSFATAANSTNALTFKFDGTNWNLISNSGTGGGSNAQGPVGTGQISNGAGALSAGGTLDNGTIFQINRDMEPSGPNPYVDVRTFGVRGVAVATPATAGMTGSINSGSHSLTVSTTSCPGQTASVCFVNGDSLVIPGAGTSVAISTPSAPTITLKNTRGPTGSLDDVAGVAGAISCSYKISYMDFAGGITATSSPGTSSTCAGTLGSNIVNITSASRTNNVITYTTSSVHTITVGTRVEVQGQSDGSFNGVFRAATTPDNTHFTVNTGLDTRNGATSSSTGGTAVWYVANSITWPTPPAGVFEVLIYGCRNCSPGNENLLAASYPTNDSNFPVTQWDDFGATMSGSLNVPWWAPTTPLASAQADPLKTKITAGAGTVNLTLAAAAGTTVSSVPVRFDNGPNIATAAAAGGQIHFPSTSGFYVVNSNTDLHSFSSYTFTSIGPLYLQGTLWLRNNFMRWYGDRFLTTGQGGQFSLENYTPVYIGSGAYPGVYEDGNSGPALRGLAFLDTSTNGGIDLFINNPGLPSGNVEDILATGASYMSVPIVLQGASAWTAKNISVLTGPSQVNGSTSAPSFWCNQCGLARIDNFSFNRRGMLFTTTQSAADDWDVTFGRIQGPITPTITVQGPGAAGTIGANLRTLFTQLDTTFYPTVDYLQSVGQTGLNWTNYGGYGPVSSPALSGDPITGISNICSGDNLTCFSNGQALGVSLTTFGTAPAGEGNSAIDWSAGFPAVGYLMPACPAPTLSLSSGGNVSTSQHSYQVVCYDAFGNFAPTSAAATITPTTGNQTVNISIPGAPSGVAGFTVLRDGQFLSNSGHNCANFIGPAGLGPWPDTLASACNGNAPAFTNALSAGLASGGLAAGTFNVVGNGFINALTSTPTASRSTLFPDASGTVALINVAQTWTASQTFNNASQLRFLSTNGTNYAGFQGGASTSNLIWLFPTTDSSGTQCLSSNGSLQLSWSPCSGGTGTPGGATTQVQYNAAGSFGGSTNLTWVSPALTIGTAATSTGQLVLMNGGTSGVGATIQNNAATTAYNFNLPSGPGTSGQPLLSGGGVAAPMTFGTLGTGAGGTATTSYNASSVITSNASANALVSDAQLTVNSSSGPQLTVTSSAGLVPMVVNIAPSPTVDLLDLDVNNSKVSWFDSSVFLHTPQTTYTGSGPLTLSGTEGTCPSPVSGSDIICLGDSTSHSAQISNNGVTFKPIALWTNNSPTAHGVVVASPTGGAFPQQNSIAACGSGIPVVGNGASADPSCSTLTVPGGGTGGTTFTTHGILMGEGTAAFDASAAGTSGQAFLSGGASADGAYGALNLGGGSSIITGICPVVNGCTGSSTLAGASIATVTGTITTGHCADFNAATVITDSGAPCGGGSSPARLDQITAATATNTINSTTFPQTWNWALTGSTVAFKRGENTAATGTSNILDQVSTLSGSTSVVAQWDNNGNGYRVGSTGLLQPIGTGGLATPGAAHNLVVSQAGSSAVTYVPPVSAGKVLIDNGPGNDPSFQDPVISQAFMNLFNAVSATATQTSSAVRNPVFSQTGTLQITWASITGSPATCTLQIQGVDSLGNALNDGSTISVSPANGTTSQTFTAASTLQTAAQIKAIYACGTYPSTGTLSLDFTTIPNVNVTNTVTVSGTVTTTPPSNASTNVAQFGGAAVVTGTGASGSGIPRVTISNDSSLAANQSVNVNQIGGSGVVADPCQQQARTAFVISLTASTQLITGAASKQTYICSLQFSLSNTADNVALVEGTGTTCATGTAGMAGGSTAATGWNLLANGSVTNNNAPFWVFKTATAADNVCLLVSSVAQVSGIVTYVQQ